MNRHPEDRQLLPRPFFPYYFKRTTQVLGNILQTIKDADIGTWAGSLTFTTILSIAPLMALAFVIAHKLGIFDRALLKVEPFLIQNLAAGAGSQVSAYLSQFLKNTKAASVGLSGVVGLLITGLLTYFQIVKAMDRIYKLSGSIGFWRRFVRSLLLLILAPPLVAASLSLTTAMGAILKHIPLGGFFVAGILNTTIFALGYFFLASKSPSSRHMWAVSTCLGFFWEGLKWGYGFYAKNAVQYSRFYGSFSALPLFLVWIYVSWYTFLIGACVIQTLSRNGRIQS